MSTPESMPPLDLDLAAALADPSPLALLSIASGIAAAATPQPTDRIIGRPAPRHSVLELAQMFGEMRKPTYDALLQVWAEMLGDEILLRRITATLSTRSSTGSAFRAPSPIQTPNWLSQLTQLRATRAVTIGDVHGEEETIFVELALAEHLVTLACPISLAGMPMVKSTYPLDASVAQILTEFSSESDPLVRVAELTLPDASERLTEALKITDMTLPSEEEDQDWPFYRPILEWVLRILPQGGIGYDRRERSEDEIAALVTAFAASADGKTASDDILDHAHRLLEINANYGAGDPLLWGPLFTERVLLDLYPRKMMAPESFMRSLPQALAALIPWANERAGLSPEATAAALEALGTHTAEYLSFLDESDLPGAGMAFGVGDFGNGPFGSLDSTSSEVLRAFSRLLELRVDPTHLADEVGGAQALSALDDAPIPVEALTLKGIEQDVWDRVQLVAAGIENEGGGYFQDVELVTVALRLLRRFALADPKLFRGRASSSGTAAAICWIAAKNNEWFDGSDPVRTVKGLEAAFELRSSVQPRAKTILSTLGDFRVPGTSAIMLGDPELLTSERRGALIRASAELDELGRLGFLDW